MHIEENNNSQHGKFYRFLLPFSSKFPNLNFAPFVLSIYSCYMKAVRDTNSEPGLPMVEPPLTATSLQRPHFFVKADKKSIYLDSCLKPLYNGHSLLSPRWPLKWGLTVYKWNSIKRYVICLFAVPKASKGKIRAKKEWSHIYVSTHSRDNLGVNWNRKLRRNLEDL